MVVKIGTGSRWDQQTAAFYRLTGDNIEWIDWLHNGDIVVVLSDPRRIKLDVEFVLALVASGGIGWVRQMQLVEP